MRQSRWPSLLKNLIVLLCSQQKSTSILIDKSEAHGENHVDFSHGLSLIHIDLCPWLCNHIHKEEDKEKRIHNTHKPIWSIAFHFCSSGSVDYTGIKCVSLTHVCIHTFTCIHTYTFIRVLGLYRDKARLSILTQWLNTHTHTHTHTSHLLTLCT